jgi:non-homologous end joining protein Ku
MAPRTFWTGQLRLSLVTIPTRLYPADTERRVELHQVHASPPASATERKWA